MGSLSLGLLGATAIILLIILAIYWIVLPILLVKRLDKIISLLQKINKHTEPSGPKLG
jgi:hypothetical protein